MGRPKFIDWNRRKATQERQRQKAKSHLFGGPYKGCRCAVCMVPKRNMTAKQIRNLPSPP